MSIKRYNPRYKKLAQFKQPIWLEKRGKILKFSRQKWDSLKKNCFSKRFKFFNQDVATCNLGKSFNDDKFTRLKKTYKYLLQDKQRLQLYFGFGRLRFYQLKAFSNSALRFAKNRNLSSSASLMYLLDNRLQNVIYRLCFVSSLLQAKCLINSGHVRVSNVLVTSSNFFVRHFDTIVFDPVISSVLNLFYLKFNFPLLYFKRKRWCCSFTSSKINCFSKGFLGGNSIVSLLQLKSDLERLKSFKLSKK